MKRRAWLFATPAIVGIAAFLVLVAYKQGLLASRDRLYFVTPSAVGITSGMPVKLNGFIVGSVDKIVLLPPSMQSDRRVQVELGIYRDYMGYIPKTTVARLVQEGLIGQIMIELQPQRYDARPVANGEMLPFERSKGLSEIAEELQNRLTPVLQNMQTLTAQLNDPKGSFQQILKSGSELTANLNQTNRQLQQTLAQTSHGAQAIEQHTNATLNTANHALQTIDQAAPALIGKIDRTAEQLLQISEEARRITFQSSQQVLRIVDDTQSIAHQSNQIMQGARQTWPVNLMVAPPQSRTLPLDSQDGLAPDGMVAR